MITLAAIQRRVGVDADGKLGPATLGAIARALGMNERRTLANEKAFYDACRALMGGIDETQLAVMKAMLDKAAHWNAAWLAYGFATAWHEARLRPVEEIGKGRGHSYGNKGKHGQAQYGRGLVQLTWDYNYAKADDELDLNGALTRDYALALRPDLAVAILVRGMEEGWFTGKRLAQYLPDERGTIEQFTAARRIINGTDRAAMIAGYAQRFQAALTAGAWA